MTNRTSLSFRAVPAMAVAHPVAVLCAVAVVTLFFAFHLPSLSFKTTIQDLILEDLPAAAQYREFKAVFGSDEMIRIVVRCDDVFDPATFETITDLSRRLAGLNGVSRVLSLPEVKETVEVSGAWDLPKFKALIGPVDLFSRNLVSDDFRATILTLILDSESEKYPIIDEVEKILEAVPKTFSLYQIGMPIVSQALAGHTRQDFFRLPPVTLILIATFLLILLRNPHGLIVPMTTVILSLTWSFGLMALFRIPLSMLTMIVPVFLIAVGTCYCMVMSTEFFREVQFGQGARDALRATFSHMTLPVMLAVITTLIGVASLFINRITAIREFAFFACSGILSLTVLLFSYYPATLSMFPPPARPIRIGFNAEPMLQRILSWVVRINLSHSRIALWIIAGIAFMGCVGVFFIQVETNPISFFKKNTRIYRNFHDIHQDLSGSFPVHVVMTGIETDYFEDPGHLAELARFQEFLGTLPGVDKSISFADYLKLVNYASNRYDSKFYALPEEAYTLRMLINAYKSLLGNDMLTRFMSQDRSQANVLLLTHLSSSREFLALRDRILSYTKLEFPKEIAWQVTGLGMVISDSSQQLTLGQIKSLVLSLSLIFLIMVTLFVSFRVGFIALLPNVFPILVNFGIMGWFGINLSMVTSMVASIAIGLAVDDTIHYLVRYNIEFKKDLDKDRAMRDTIMGVGRPIIYSTLTLCLGVSILVFSHFQPTAVFGALMILIMISALVGNLILLPILLLHVELVTAWDLLRHMPSVAVLPPAVVHELNQPLNAIKVGSEFLKLMVKKGGEIRSDHLAAVSREISEQVDRASRMIHRLGEFGRKPEIEKQSLDINEPIRWVLSILSNPIHLDNIRLRIELTEPLPPVLGNHGQLVQVIFHLISNAWESFTPEAGSNTAMDGLERSKEIMIRSFPDRDRVMVVVADTGLGVPSHIKDRVFEPFFTTKTSGKGKGLGLSICRQIVLDHGGRISFESTAGGSTVRMAFPRAERGAS